MKQISNIMERLKNYIVAIILTMLLCTNVCSVYAQTVDEFCGTWYSNPTFSTYETPSIKLQSKRRLILKISKYDSDLKIESEIEIMDNRPFRKVPHAPCENISYNGRNVSWSQMSNSIDYGVASWELKEVSPSVEYHYVELSADTLVYKTKNVKTHFKRYNYNFEYKGVTTSFSDDIVLYRQKQ